MMRRSPLKQGKPLERRTPMARGTGFKSPAAGASLLRVAAVQAQARAREPRLRKPLKSSRPVMTPIRKSARGEACTLRFPGICNRNPETTAWCHSNSLADGKGMGIKARDEEGCYGCSDCHAWLDGGYAGKMPRAAVDSRFDAARAESRDILRAKGLITNSEAATVAAGAASKQITLE